MHSRENIPLVMLGALSAAILIFFAASERAIRAEPHLLEDCGWSEDNTASLAWSRAGNTPGRSWNPAFPASPPSRPLAQSECMRSNTTAII
jgi:hypothetical protein